MSGSAQRPGPPPLAPFGLRLHHDGRFSHDGEPILNRRLREHFDRSVEYLPEEGKFIVRLGHFRGQVEVQEAGFFVRAYEADRGEIVLSDGSRERLDVGSLSLSPIDAALLCRVKRALVAEGLLARFSGGAQSELLLAVEERDGRLALCVGGEALDLPDLSGERGGPDARVEPVAGSSPADRGGAEPDPASVDAVAPRRCVERVASSAGSASANGAPGAARASSQGPLD